MPPPWRCSRRARPLAGQPVGLAHRSSGLRADITLGRPVRQRRAGGRRGDRHRRAGRARPPSSTPARCSRSRAPTGWTGTTPRGMPAHPGAQRRQRRRPAAERPDRRGPDLCSQHDGRRGWSSHSDLAFGSRCRLRRAARRPAGRRDRDRQDRAPALARRRAVAAHDLVRRPGGQARRRHPGRPTTRRASAWSCRARPWPTRAVGDPVAVMNTNSKKVIQAVVTGPDQAVVGPEADAIRAALSQSRPHHLRRPPLSP